MPAKKSAKSKISTPVAKPAKKKAAKTAPKVAAVVSASPAKKAAPTKSAPKLAKKPVAIAVAPPKKIPVKAAAKAPAKTPASGVFVRFERYSPKSTRVELVGSFNGWALGTYPLTRDESGVWNIQIRLAPGTYEYKYVYDGAFYEPDPEREQIANPFGSANNLLIVT
jgi:hypothetical protein